MVCATPRKAPSSAYFELEHHPAIKVAYTFILDTHKKYSTPKEIKNACEGCGYSAHTISAKDRLSAGASMKGNRLAAVGLACSLTNSLIASAKGCGIPIIPGLLGPFRF